MSEDEYEKIKREIVFEKVTKAIREDSKNWAKRLENMGFSFIDDEENLEQEEEKSAVPENLNQEFLVAYLESHINLSNEVLNVYIQEKESETPNHPLLRKYFKRGNEPLKKMLLMGLDQKPNDGRLLGDLTYFHEFTNILSQLIERYLRACEVEEDMDRFRELAMDFYNDTNPDGYEALYELVERYGADSKKGQIVRETIREIEAWPESIKF